MINLDLGGFADRPTPTPRVPKTTPAPFRFEDDDVEVCAERGEVCFSDLECCEPYQCDNRSYYCDKKPRPPSPPTPTPSPVDGGGPFSFSFDFDDSEDDDSFWDTWVPAPAPDEKTLPPVSDPDLSFDFDRDEEPDRPTDKPKPTSDQDCLDRLTPNMRVSQWQHAVAKQRSCHVFFVLVLCIEQTSFGRTHKITFYCCGTW